MLNKIDLKDVSVVKRWIFVNGIGCIGLYRTTTHTIKFDVKFRIQMKLPSNINCPQKEIVNTVVDVINTSIDEINSTQS